MNTGLKIMAKINHSKFKIENKVRKGMSPLTAVLALAFTTLSLILFYNMFKDVLGDYGTTLKKFLGGN